MTSCGRKRHPGSSPKGRAKASYIGTRNGAYLYRYAPFTVLRLPLTRAARKSDGRKTVSVLAPLCLSLWERWPSAARTERANNGNVQSENAGTSQADDVPRAQGSSVTWVTALPKGEPRHRILAQEMERICIDTFPFTVLRLPLNARAARKSDGRKRFPSRHPLPLPVGEVAERSEDGEGK